MIEGAAAETGTVELGKGEVHVLMLFEDGLLVCCQHALHDLVDLGTGQHRRTLDTLELSVHSHTRRRATDEEQVRPVMIPEDLEPWGDSFVSVVSS